MTKRSPRTRLNVRIDETLVLHHSEAARVGSLGIALYR